MGDGVSVIPPVLSSDGHMITESVASGTHYQIITNGTFTRTISITGTGSGTDPHWTGGVSLGYTVTATPVIMGIQGTDIDQAGNHGALIGQNMTASLSAGNYTLSNYSWNVPGHVFLSWQVPALPAPQPFSTYNPIPSSMWSLASPWWYWQDNAVALPDSPFTTDAPRC